MHVTWIISRVHNNRVLATFLKAQSYRETMSRRCFLFFSPFFTVNPSRRRRTTVLYENFIAARNDRAASLSTFHSWHALAFKAIASTLSKYTRIRRVSAQISLRSSLLDRLLTLLRRKSLFTSFVRTYMRMSHVPPPSITVSFPSVLERGKTDIMSDKTDFFPEIPAVVAGGLRKIFSRL